MGRFKFAAVPLVIALAALGTVSASAREYVVLPGDTLWAISSSQHVDLAQLIRANHIQNPDRIYPGERLNLPDTAPFGTISASAGQYIVQPGDTLWAISSSQHVDLGRLVSANNFVNPDLIYPGEQLNLPDTTPLAGIHGAAAKAIITAAARHHGLNPNFVLALSYWESGWNQSTVSLTGAVGLMQIEPYTADWAGPSLLGRKVDIHDATDNAELGAALLRHYLEVFNDPKLSLAAYYQGESATRKYGIYPSSRSYVDGIWALRNRFQQLGS